MAFRLLEHKIINILLSGHKVSSLARKEAPSEMICNIVGRSSSADNIDCLTKQHV